MQKFLIATYLAVLAGGSVSCASMASIISNGGLAQEFTFISEPPGVTLLLNGSQSLGVTPLVDVKIERSRNAFVVAKMEGFEDQTIRLTHKLNYWVFGNILIGGLFGITTDMANNADVKLDPTTYHVTMTPTNVTSEQMQQHLKTRWARNFILLGYPHIQADLVRGDGEYLCSVLAILKVSADQREQALRRLRKLAGESGHAQEFAKRVLNPS